MIELKEIMDSLGITLLVIGIIAVIVIIGYAKSARTKKFNDFKNTSEITRNTPRNLSGRVNSTSKNKAKSKDLEWLKNELIENEENVMHLSRGFQINIPKGHRYDLFSAIKITKENKKTIKVVAVLTKVIPSYLDIRPANTYYGTTKDSFSVIDLNRSFKFYSSAPDMWREIFANYRIKDLLQYNATHIQHFYLREEYMESLVSYDQAIISILTLTKLIHEEMKKLFGVLDSYEIEKLICFNCKDPFDPMEEVCDKCGSSRPRCIVCLLDLHPSDIDQEIVTTPCCGVYAHKSHIISWLKQNPHCPNCHANLSHWLGQMQII
jgi:hypothetical protein